MVDVKYLHAGTQPADAPAAVIFSAFFMAVSFSSVTDFAGAHSILTAPFLVALLELCSALVLLPFNLPLELVDIISLIGACVLTRFFFNYSGQSLRQVILVISTYAWAVRLALYLLYRTIIGFHDSRLNNFRDNPAKAAKLYIGHVFWISFSLLPIWVGMSSEQQLDLNVFDYFSIGIFFVGFSIEAIADLQKSRFYSHARASGNQPYPFCNVGLFRYSRFPNYFGDCMLWTGLSLLALRTAGTYTVLLLPICPLSVYNLLMKVSVRIAFKSMRTKCSKEQYDEWKSISLFVPRVLNASAALRHT